MEYEMEPGFIRIIDLEFTFKKSNLMLGKMAWRLEAFLEFQDFAITIIKRNGWDHAYSFLIVDKENNGIFVKTVSHVIRGIMKDLNSPDEDKPTVSTIAIGIDLAQSELSEILMKKLGDKLWDKIK